MFGGGSDHRERFASVWALSLKERKWREKLQPVGSEMPWERTYHVSELCYPYLIVHGGEGVANMDLDDMWVFHLPTSQWQRLKFEGEQPCARRFHASALIGNVLYVFGGCEKNYRLLNDAYKVNLSALFNSNPEDCFNG